MNCTISGIMDGMPTGKMVERNVHGLYAETEVDESGSWDAVTSGLQKQGRH